MATQVLAPAPAGTGLRPVLGDPGPPVVGHTLRYLRDPLQWAASRYDRYGPLSWSQAMGTRLVSVLGPEATARVLTGRGRVYSQAGWEHFIGPFFHGGLMLLDFDEHRYHRRVLQQAFTPQRLRSYLPGMGAAGQAAIGAWERGEGVLVYPRVKQLTLDLATAVFMGGRLGREGDAVNRALIAAVRAGTAVVRRPVPGGRWWRGLRGRRRLDAYMTAQLPDKRSGDGQDLFAALCHAEAEDGSRLSDEAVVDHMVFLLMAAHDTTTIATSTVLYLLAKHPEWQERAREESSALGELVLDHDGLRALASLDLVIREALRLVPPVPALPRMAVEDTELLGHHIPAGTIVSTMPAFTHRLPAVWPRPERFDPERFAADRREDRVHPLAWMPFGAGPHACIGMHFAFQQIKSLVHQMLLLHRWSVPPDYEMPLDTTALPVPADGLPVTLRPLR